MKKPRYFLYGLLLAFLLIQPPLELQSFGGAGPYTHVNITRQALNEYSKKHGYEVRANCAELIIQGNLGSDTTEHQEHPTYHCDSNYLAGCSWRLDQFKGQANKSISATQSLLYVGRAMHIVQDFYAHTNWVEIFEFSMFTAPLSVFKDVGAPPDLQSGIFPDQTFDLNSQSACFFVSDDERKRPINNATHACLNKDSNISPRGGTPVPNSIITHHELAGLYAIEHSVKLLEYFAQVNPWVQYCMVRPTIFRGCNDFVTGNLFR